MAAGFESPFLIQCPYSLYTPSLNLVFPIISLSDYKYMCIHTYTSVMGKILCDHPVWNSLIYQFVSPNSP